MRTPGGTTRIAIGAALAGGAVLFALETHSHRRFVEAARQARTASLVARAGLLARAISPADLEGTALSERLRDLTGMRVRVVSAEGRVIVDSAGMAARPTEDLGHVREVAEALRAGEAFAERESGGARGVEFVAAARLRGGGGAVLVSQEFEPPPLPLRTLLAGGLAVVSAVALAATLLARRLETGVRSLLAGVEAIQAGRELPNAFPRGDDSIGRLGEAIDLLAARLHAAISTEEVDAARLGTILEAMDEGVLAIDPDERISFLNGRARAILGIAAAERVEGRGLYELVRNPTILSVVRGSRDHRRVMSVEVTHDTPERRLIHVRAAPVSAGAPLVILVVRDMSRVRHLERIRSDFVSNVSHELRTPLAAISAASENLEDPETLRSPESGPAFVSAIRRNVARLQDLLDDILTLSRLESRPDLLDRAPIDLAAVVRSSVEDLRARADAAGVALRLEAPPSLTVTGDAGSLRRVADNLILNAITYTPRGGRADVSLRAEDGSALLRVADTGIGIAEADLERIFERFYRVDKARSRSAGGTGLGLAIVKHAVNLHRGSVQVDSRIGEGSTFTVRIPIGREETKGENGT